MCYFLDDDDDDDVSSLVKVLLFFFVLVSRKSCGEVNNHGFFVEWMDDR